MLKNVLVMVCLVFLFGNQRLEAQITCQQYKEEIKTFIYRFENLQKKRQAKEVLDLFTPPIESEDVANYSFLAGLDAAAPRLYSTGTTHFHLVSFQIVDIYQSWWINGCIVNVVEKRKYYPHGGYQGKTSTAKHVLNFELLYWYNNGERIWQVQSYRPYGFFGKFGGFEW